MKRLLILSSFIVISGLIFSQEWIKNLPQDKLREGTLTFYEIRNAFNDYWEPFDVENGYYYKDGEKVKAPYWKQFRRWEWYWEPRVDPQTGAFPNTSAIDEFRKWKKANPDISRSPSGSWTSLGPDQSPGGYAGLGRLNCVAFRPQNNDVIYVGAASGGIWKTDDGGSTWTPLGDENGVLGVSDIIVVNPVTGPDILYIATGDRDGGSMWSLGGGQGNDNNSIGVLKSVDGGVTWQPTGLVFNVSSKIRTNRLLRDPSNPNTFYAATTNGLYKTTDDCVNWTLITPLAFIDLEFQPGNSSVLYGSTETWGNTAIFRSTNAGASFNQVASYGGQRTELAVSGNQPNWVYALVANTSGGLFGVYKSTDGGANFSQVYSSSTNNLLGWSCFGTGTTGQGGYDLVINADPNNANTVYVGGVNTWKSTDGGSTFNIVNHWSGGTGCPAQVVHADKHYLAFQNGSSTLFECNDGGLYSTSDGGNTWTHLSTGMAITQIYRIGVGQTSPDEVILGSQDNGSKSRLSGVWTDVLGGDGMECIIDPTDTNTQYASLYYGDLYRTTDYWVNSTNISSPSGGSGYWVTPYCLDPANSFTIYAGYSEVWKSTNQGNSWTQISSFGGSTLKSIAVAPNNSNVIYTATRTSLYVTTNGGTSWTDITGTLPTWNSDITYIAVKDDDENTVWVTMGEYNSDGVFETTNGGSTWTNISAGLPNLPVMCIVENKQNSTDTELYVGTDVGIYVKLGSANWVPFYSGLPNVVVAELDIYYDDDTPSDSRIYAGTFGRGVWKSDMYTLYAPPTADFTADDTTGVAPLDVQFTDLSIDSVNTWQWDFGDGNTSSLQNPSYTYNSPGTYTVALTVTGPGGSDTETKTDYIDVSYTAPTADFEGSPTTGPAPLDVQFTDLSVDSVNTWLWDFGNGDTSNIQNPLYTYQDPGLYTVKLTVTGPGGSDFLEKTDYIDVSYAPPIAEFSGTPISGYFPLQVAFSDLSTGSITSWLWYFGDGNTSANQSPSHTYASAGTYTVSLKIVGPGGYDSTAKVDYINVLVGLGELKYEGISVYPNPFSDQLYVKGLDNIQELIITNVAGVDVYTYVSNANTEELKVNTAGYHPGIYFCRIINNDGSIVLVKLIKK